MNKPYIITPTVGILKKNDIKALIKSIPTIAITEDGIYNVHAFVKEGDTESVLLSHSTHRGTTCHKVKVRHHKYQTDTFIINEKKYNVDKLQEVKQ